MEKQGGISPRYSPGRDRDHTHPTPKLPDTATFQAELLEALSSPEMQKAAVSGLIQKIIVHPTAALEVQCSFSSLFSNNSATGNRTPV